MDPKTLDFLMRIGVQYANRVNDVLHLDPVIGQLQENHIALASICHAGAMARLTKMDLESLLSLMTLVYQNLELKDGEGNLLEGAPVSEQRIIDPNDIPGIKLVKP